MKKKDDVKKTVNFSVNKLLSHLQAHHSHSSRGVLQNSPILFKSVRVFDTFLYIPLVKRKKSGQPPKTSYLEHRHFLFHSVQFSAIY